MSFLGLDIAQKGLSLYTVSYPSPEASSASPSSRWRQVPAAVASIMAAHTYASMASGKLYDVANPRKLNDVVAADEKLNKIVRLPPLESWEFVTDRRSRSKPGSSAPRPPLRTASRLSASMRPAWSLPTWPVWIPVLSTPSASATSASAFCTTSSTFVCRTTAIGPRCAVSHGFSASLAPLRFTSLPPRSSLLPRFSLVSL